MSNRQSKVATPVNKRAAELMRDALNVSPMNRKQLADASGVPDGTLSGILAGTSPVYIDQFHAVARAVGANILDWWAELDEAANPPPATKRVPGRKI